MTGGGLLAVFGGVRQTKRGVRRAKDLLKNPRKVLKNLLERPNIKNHLEENQGAGQQAEANHI